MTDRPGDVARAREHPDFAVAVPTPDHFIPLLYLAGLAGRGEPTADVLVDGYAYGSLSMTSYTLDASAPPASAATAAGSGVHLPDPETVPPDDTNL